MRRPVQIPTQLSLSLIRTSALAWLLGTNVRALTCITYITFITFITTQRKDPP
jgi:hypothetical protein